MGKKRTYILKIYLFYNRAVLVVKNTEEVICKRLKNGFCHISSRVIKDASFLTVFELSLFLPSSAPQLPTQRPTQGLIFPCVSAHVSTEPSELRTHLFSFFIKLAGLQLIPGQTESP